MIRASGEPAERAADRLIAAESEILSLDEAAAHFKCSTKTVQKMAREQELPYFMMGKLWRFRRSELRAWEQARTRTTKKEVA
jgi:excisionase family DNA binding protein